MAKPIITSHLLLDDKFTNKSNIVIDSAVLMSGISSLMTVIDVKSDCSKMCSHIRIEKIFIKILPNTVITLAGTKWAEGEERED